MRMPKTARNRTMDGDHKKKPECKTCGKEFKSEKALHGHMRCHPERGWRGMHPPASATAHRSSSSSPGGVGDEVPHEDCYMPLLSWPVTGSRGRKCGASTGSSSSAVSDANDTKEENENVVLRKEYPCDFCGKAFPSPRALGGHESSCHCKPRNSEPQEAQLNQVTNPGESDQMGARKILGFDLNELPPADDEK